jgi:hypothetical protein
MAQPWVRNSGKIPSSLQEKLIAFLKKNGIAYAERYFWS